MPFPCKLCPRMCGVVRGKEQPGGGKGMCRLGEDPAVARIALHFGEEPCISGDRGSGTVFFSGCPLGCAFCQNWQISRECFGKRLSQEGLWQSIRRFLVEWEPHNINFVSPTQYTHSIWRLLREHEMPVPVVWNSGGYERPECIRAMAGKVQIYLPDIKYVDPGLSGKLSGAPDYFKWASASVREMYAQVGPPQLDGDGIMARGLMVRHLILPGCTDDSMRVLDWIARNLPGAWVSLMAQYTPYGEAKDMPGFHRRITKREYERVYGHMLDLGLEDGYVQELEAAEEDHIPPFDLSGVEEAPF